MLKAQEDEVRDMSDNEKVMRQNLLALNEMQHVFNHARPFLDEMDADDMYESVTGNAAPPQQASIHAHQRASGRARKKTVVESELAVPGEPFVHDIKFIAGIISNTRKIIFNRMLHRMCRGNVLIRMSSITTEIKDPATVGQSLPLYKTCNIRASRCSSRSSSCSCTVKCYRSC